MPPIPRNNAFGAGSPSWNLSFPSGNLTAAEILAYLPHWLKSVDVIDRFVTNGGRSRTIAAMINEFRHQPTGPTAVFPSNSAQIMMSYAMRRAGYKGWTVGTHGKWRQESEANEQDLSVANFRPQRLTHPKKVTKKNLHDFARNQEADPIPFKDLALHVKKHPSGPDALDLTRCVLYAVVHPDEQLLFPTDFVRLVDWLGGPQTPTYFHLDRQIFDRRNNVNFTTPARSVTLETDVMPDDHMAPLSKVMPPARGDMSTDSGMFAVLVPTKRAVDSVDTGHDGNKRRSSRLAGKVFNLREDSGDQDIEDKDTFDSPYSVHALPLKKRGASRVPSVPGSLANDSDYILNELSGSEEDVDAEDATDDDLVLSAPSRGRIAARKARQKIQTLATTPKVPTPIRPKTKSKPTAEPSAEMMQAARELPYLPPVFLRPPVISEDRLKINDASVWLYSEDGCTTYEELWASALSSTRFGGPRRSPPFRELYRLTDPHPQDPSDWAENIRWAKQQHRFYGSATWTEYDYHLELITQHRLATFWVSEYVIMADM